MITYAAHAELLLTVLREELVSADNPGLAGVHPGASLREAGLVFMDIILLIAAYEDALEDMCGRVIELDLAAIPEDPTITQLALAGARACAAPVPRARNRNLFVDARSRGSNMNTSACMSHVDNPNTKREPAHE